MEERLDLFCMALLVETDFSLKYGKTLFKKTRLSRMDAIFSGREF